MVKKDGSSNITLLEAVETLSAIADLDISQDLTHKQKQLLFQNSKLTHKAIRWLERNSSEHAVDQIKAIFKVILGHLKKFFSKNEPKDDQSIENIKTIMVLVGEAAKKLDRYTHLFKTTKNKSITELKEYKQLQEFYLSRIARKLDEGSMGQWIIGLAQTVWTKKIGNKNDAFKKLQANHVFVDLESLKKDVEYDLLFVRQEDGTRFFNPRLIKNIKLVCDFEYYLGRGNAITKPLENLAFVKDKIYHTSAKFLVRHLQHHIDKFYRDAWKHKDREFVECLNKCLIALMLSANPKYLLENSPAKSCSQYFIDFQKFLRFVLQSNDYQKLIAYPSKHSNQLANCLLGLTHRLCMCLLENLNINQQFSFYLNQLLEEARSCSLPEQEDITKGNRLSKDLASDYYSLSQYLKYSNGHLIKDLNILEEGITSGFDPFLQNSLPSQQYAICSNEHKISNILMPSPIQQSQINKVHILDEFRGFIRGCEERFDVRRHLIFNFQDRTSWKEHVRSITLEELQHVKEFSNYLTVVTLPKNTDFYYQLPPYQNDNHADSFMKNLIDQLGDYNTGFYIPEQVYQGLTQKFLTGTVNAIHRIFFSKKNVLLREHRLDFIEIFYLFLQLKIIELSACETFSFTCKDGVDIGAPASAQLYAFLKLINNDQLTVYDKDFINMLLYTPGLLARERIIIHERFARFNNVLKTIESLRDTYGSQNFVSLIQEAFREYFTANILNSKTI